MADIVYRSVKVICQNNIQEPLILMGFGTLRGDWTEEPIAGQTIDANESGDWMSQSLTLNSGCSGYLSFILSSGHVRIFWNLPWTGYVMSEVRSPNGYGAELQIDDQQPAYPVVLITLWGPDRGPESSARSHSEEEVKGVLETQKTVKAELDVSTIEEKGTGSEAVSKARGKSGASK